jgi:hypothetical protein
MNPKQFVQGYGVYSCNLLAEKMLFLSIFVYDHYLPKYMKHLHRDSISGQFPGFVTLAPFVSSPKQCWSYLCSSTIITSHGTGNIFAGDRTRAVFRACDLCFCNFLLETNKFGLGVVLPSYRKYLRRGSNPGQFFQGCGLCFCNLLFEANNFVLDAVLVSCLVS